MPNDISRRGLLRATGLLSGAALLGAVLPRSAGAALDEASPVVKPAAKPIRLVHMTDIHVQPEARAGEGLAACLKHIAGLPADRAPELIVTGGDLIMDSFAQERARTQELWDLFTNTFKDHCGVRVEHTLGNHDIWGWNKGKSKTDGSEKGWGKAWVCDTLGLAKPYRSYDHGGWHFIHLDSVHTDPNDPNGYVGKVGKEQFEWIKADLAAVPEGRPVVVISHIPILTVTHLTDPRIVKKDDFEISGGLMHLDAAALHNLFASSKKVKLCLSGHIHRRDRVELDGVTYLCDGAVCGGWWTGRRDRCDEGYGLLELLPDGSFRQEYLTYGWEAEKAE